MLYFIHRIILRIYGVYKYNCYFIIIIILKIKDPCNEKNMQKLTLADVSTI